MKNKNLYKIFLKTKQVIKHSTNSTKTSILNKEIIYYNKRLNNSKNV